MMSTMLPRPRWFHRHGEDALVGETRHRGSAPHYRGGQEARHNGPSPEEESMRRRVFIQSGLALAAASALPAALAQQKYPSKPIRFVVPFAAGGGGDVVARMLAQRLQERINNPIVVENKTGAGGNIGSDFVLKSPPDGYTLLNMSSTYPIQAAVSKLPFDPIGDMQPIIMVSRDPVVLLVNSNSPFKDARELHAAAVKNPGKLT